MSQNQQSGASANQWGRETARKLIKAYGGKSTSTISNEFTKDGKLLVMKCANLDTTSVGASLKMLDRIDGVIAAFATSPSCFSLYFMDPVKFRESMRDTRSRGPSAGKVGLATKACFIAEGKALGDIRI